MRIQTGLFLVGTLLLNVAARAQNYSIDWFTIAGGGGTSSGGNFTVSGTIGQPATATMSGGNYSLTGGFWSIISLVQTPGAPLLSITRSGQNAVISWSAGASGFTLEDSSSLSSGSWLAAPVTLITNGATISATVPASTGYKFYRLGN